MDDGSVDVDWISSVRDQHKDKISKTRLCSRLHLLYSPPLYGRTYAALHPWLAWLVFPACSLGWPQNGSKFSCSHGVSRIWTHLVPTKCSGDACRQMSLFQVATCRLECLPSRLPTSCGRLHARSAAPRKERARAPAHQSPTCLSCLLLSFARLSPASTSTSTSTVALCHRISHLMGLASRPPLSTDVRTGPCTLRWLVRGALLPARMSHCTCIGPQSNAMLGQARSRLLRVQRWRWRGMWCRRG
jgi:hypothetical protein